MITITLHLLFISLGTWHIRTGVTLPHVDYKFSFAPLMAEITTDAVEAPVLPGSRAIPSSALANTHAPAGTDVTPAPDTQPAGEETL